MGREIAELGKDGILDISLNGRLNAQEHSFGILDSSVVNTGGGSGQDIGVRNGMVVGEDVSSYYIIFLCLVEHLSTLVFAHGWWTKDGEKISKSLGNAIDPVKLVETVSNIAFHPRFRE